MTLALLILLPIIAAIGVVAAPKQHSKTIALVGTLAPLAWFISVLVRVRAGEADQMAVSAAWFEPLGLTFSLGTDAVSLLLVGLTLLLGPICVLASYTAITERVKTYYAWLLVLQGAMAGVFLARDLILFYTFFEFTLIPMYVLISLWGSTNRKAAATKFFLFTFTGSILTLAAMVFIAWKHAEANNGEWSFAFADLQETARALPLATQTWVFLGLMAGFAVKVPLFPVHTWLPLAHTEAPTAGSVILAGVLLKLGTYGIYRFAIGFTPAAAWDLAPAIAVLSIIGILYGALVCWVQTDVKKLIAYSSVSHLGFCVLGLFAFTSIGITGSVLYMINHGLSTGALFLLIGMMYERYHTRSLKELGGLAAKMPVWATFMVFFTMASVGLPGLNGYVSEFMCLMGAFQAGDAWTVHVTAAGLPGPLGPWFAAAAGLGMIATAIYLLYMLGKFVWGPLVEPHGHQGGADRSHGSAGHGSVLPTDLSWREIGLLLPLAAFCLFLGVYPKPVLEVLEVPAREMAALGRATNETPAGSTEELGAGVASPAAAPSLVDAAMTKEATR